MFIKLLFWISSVQTNDVDKIFIYLYNMTLYEHTTF